MDKVLVVHHSAKFLRQAGSSLSQAGFEVETCPSTSSAMLKLTETSPDLVI